MYFIVLWISYVFLCVFFPFVFVVFFGEICGRHFLKHNNAKTNSFQPLRVKISIFIWTMWKNSICIDFVHKITFWSHFRSDVHTCMYKKLRNFRTVPPASQIWCQNVRETWKKKVIKCRGESFARCRVIARNVEGGPFRPPPVFLRLMPFWLLTDDMYIFCVWPPDGADHSSYPWGSAFQSLPSCCTRSSLTLLRHASSLASLSSTSSSSSYAHQFRYIFISYLFLTSLCHRHTST